MKRVRVLRSARGRAVDACKTVLIVEGALFVVGKHFVRFRRFFEFFFGRLIARISVGMIFYRKFTVRLFNIVERSAFFDTEHFVIITFFRHIFCQKSIFEKLYHKKHLRRNRTEVFSRLTERPGKTPAALISVSIPGFATSPKPCMRFICRRALRIRRRRLCLCRNRPTARRPDRCPHRRFALGFPRPAAVRLAVCTLLRRFYTRPA